MMVTHFFPNTETDTPAIHLKIDVRADDIQGVVKALREALKDAKEGCTDHSLGCSYVQKPKRTTKPGRYSMHFVGVWKEGK